MKHLITLMCVLMCSLAIADDKKDKTKSTATIVKEENKSNDVVPEKFNVKFTTSAGDFIVEVQRDWAPIGAARFHKLIKSGYYNECRFFRVIPNFMVQFGINGDPEVQKKWVKATIKDDPVKQSNKKGTITFAMAGPNTRTSQLFINYKDNGGLDDQGFAPFGRVIKGMDVVEKIESQHRQDPEQNQIQSKGNEYLKAEFPKLDFIKKASIVTDKKTTKPKVDAKKGTDKETDKPKVDAKKDTDKKKDKTTDDAKKKASTDKD